MNLDRARRLLAGALAGIFIAALFAGAMHVHRDSGGRAHPATDNCALCSFSVQNSTETDTDFLADPIRLAGTPEPLPSYDAPAAAVPDRAPARAPPTT
jgi:hypothetical protein